MNENVHEGATTRSSSLIAETLEVSMVQYMDKSTTHSTIAEVATLPTLPVANSILFATPFPSISPVNILVQGPSKSGKTSLAMDTAHSFATHAPCRGSCVKQFCTCVGAVFITRNQAASTSFPLYCQKVSVVKEQDFKAQLRALDAPEPTWNEQGLKRIHVHSLASARDLLEYLLGIQGRADWERPSGCIVIDNIESFVTSEEGMQQLSMPEMMKLVQIMAILADTGSALSRFHHTAVHIVVTMRSPSLPASIEKIIAQWFSTTKRLEKVPTAIGWKPPLDNGDTLIEIWSLSGADTSYAVICQSDGRNKIVWTINSEIRPTEQLKEVEERS